MEYREKGKRDLERHRDEGIEREREVVVVVVVVAGWP